jgi:hypothetical protein
MSAADTPPLEDQAITPELVDHPKVDGRPLTGADLVPVDTKSAIEAAAQAAVELPGVPGRDEFLALAMQARMLSLSGAAPKAIRDDPYVAFHVAMVGRDLGISPSAAIELIDVIPTGGHPRLSLSPQLLNGQIRRLGIGEIVPAYRDDTRCVAVALGPGGRDQRCRISWPDHQPDCSCDVLGDTTFTWEDARTAGLVAAGCQPGTHTPKCLNRQSQSWERCNQGYVTYPKRMLWWRAAGFAADDYFPEAGLGLYSPEELGAIVDESGRPIDPSTVSVPDGYPEPGNNGRKTSAGDDDTPASPTELWALQERIQALPDQLRDQLRAAWKGDQSRVKGYRPAALPARLLKIAQAMVNGFEASAKSAGVDLSDQMTDVRLQVAGRLLAVMSWPAQSSPDGPEPSDGTDTPDSPTETAGDEQGPVGETVDDKGRDWAPEMRNIAARVRDVGADIPNDVITGIAEGIKAMHHATLNARLREVGIPTGGPIDMRRMHLALHEMRCWIAERDGIPAFGEPCAHGYANSYCTEVGCHHWTEPF